MPARPPVLILRDDRFLRHDPGPGHPENPGRLRAIYEALDRDPPRSAVTMEPRPAQARELARVHAPEHVQRIAETAGRRVALDSDTVASPGSYAAASLAAGAAVQAAEGVAAGRTAGAFALVRPPGHHAEADAAMGFCLFNNVAVAAAHAVAELGCRRVLVLDPDVHHGNGTQRIFWERRDVLYVSTHRFPFYPGTGWFDETGAGPGLGFTVNLPMPAGMGDADFLHVYRAVVGPIAAEYAPDLILVSAGFDTWRGDPLGGMDMTADGYAALFGLFRAWADMFCPGRIACVLEGGYDPAGLVAGVRSALDAMAAPQAAGAEIDAAPSEDAREVARRARSTLSPYWPSLQS